MAFIRKVIFTLMIGIIPAVLALKTEIISNLEQYYPDTGYVKLDFPYSWEVTKPDDKYLLQSENTQPNYLIYIRSSIKKRKINLNLEAKKIDTGLISDPHEKLTIPEYQNGIPVTYNHSFKLSNIEIPKKTATMCDLSMLITGYDKFTNKIEILNGNTTFQEFEFETKWENFTGNLMTYAIMLVLGCGLSLVIIENVNTLINNFAKNQSPYLEPKDQEEII